MTIHYVRSRLFPSFSPLVFSVSLDFDFLVTASLPFSDISSLNLSLFLIRYSFLLRTTTHRTVVRCPPSRVSYSLYSYTQSSGPYCNYSKILYSVYTYVYGSASVFLFLCKIG
ncbi:hypothetical protein SCHPADRAFT_254042 [Schizopora paradoxa]|uniref:Uncharacterized protein n=1 Tax=Schizopora paradoxa TaxID=27342 RepID=A0A0H2S1F4_9AGAM|nr:hypothetical protein SCHPADRAFT_254042 [Schizopora paradoxa]